MPTPPQERESLGEGRPSEDQPMEDVVLALDERDVVPPAFGVLRMQEPMGTHVMEDSRTGALRLVTWDDDKGMALAIEKHKQDTWLVVKDPMAPAGEDEAWFPH